MAKEIKHGFGYIDRILKPDGSPYKPSDFRAAFLRIIGLYKIYSSGSRYPGRSFVYFYPYEEGDSQRFMYSSCGYVAETDKGFTLTADDGTWYFTISDVGLDDVSKVELLLNTLTVPYDGEI